MPPDSIALKPPPPQPEPSRETVGCLDVPRDAIVEEIFRLVAESPNRLVTLTGPGGAGKTWLATAVATRMRCRLCGRIAFVRLDDVRDPDELVQAIASEVDTGATGSIDDAVRTRADQPFLIVLDTFEHLTHASPMMAEILARNHNLTFLATSRRPLGLRIERTITVPPLAVPEPGEATTIDRLAASDAGAVFLATASAVAPAQPVTDAQAPVVASICRRLDGSPLAIRLAATQMPLLSPADIERHLDAPLDVFADAAGDVPARHHSLRASIAWSYDRLEPGEQASFRRLGVFAGSFPLAAAIAATDGDLEGEDARPLFRLRALVEQSLVQRIQTDDSTEPRFRLGTVERAFATEQLELAGERQSATHRLALWVLALAEDRSPDATSTGAERWLDRVATEDATFAVVREWVIDTGNWRFGLRLATALYDYWLTRGCHDDERSWLRSVLAIVPAAIPRDFAALKARLAHLLGLLSQAIGAYDEAVRAYQSALRMRRDLGDLSGELATLHNQAMLSASRGDLDHATAQFREVIAMATALSDNDSLAMSLSYLSHVLNAAGQRQAAWETLKVAGAILREHGSTRHLAFHAYCLGEVLWSKGIRREAQEQWRRCLDLSTQIGDSHSQAAASLSLCLLARDEKRLADAAGHCRDAFRYLDLRQDRRLLAEALLTSALVATASGEWPLAARLIGAGDVVLEALAAAPMPRQRDERTRALKAIRRAISDRATAAALAIGRSLPTAEAIDTATMFAATLTDSRIPTRFGGDSVALTPREHDVLDLLVRGLTNREIGDLLTLSHRTVATHVTNLLIKLNVATRAAAAGEAVRLELVTPTASLDPAV